MTELSVNLDGLDDMAGQLRTRYPKLSGPQLTSAAALICFARNYTDSYQKLQFRMGRTQITVVPAKGGGAKV